MLTSLENKDTSFPPRFDFRGNKKVKKETKNNPATKRNIFSVLIFEPPIESRYPLCSSVPVLTTIC